MVLAGGRSRRFGSPKTLALLDSEPLIWRPLRALLEAVDSAAVVCKPETPLPALPEEVEVWLEDDPAQHPAAGMAAALRRAEGRIAVLGADMPLAGAGLVRDLLAAGEGHVVASTADGLQPLAAAYSPSALPVFEDAARLGRALREIVAGLEPVLVEVDPALVANINAPEDLR